MPVFLLLMVNMAKRKKKNIRGGRNNFDDYITLPSLELHPDIKKGITVIFILAFGALSLLSLFDLAGALGVYLAKGLLLLFGWGKWVFPIVLLGLGYFLYTNGKNRLKGANYVGLFLFVISFQSLLHLLVALSTDFSPAELAADGQALDVWRASVNAGMGGGYVGLFLASVFMRLIGLWGSLLVVLGLLLVSFMLVFNTTLSSLIGRNSLFARIIYFINSILHNIFNKLFGRDEGEEAEFEEEQTELEAPVEIMEDEAPVEMEVADTLFSKKKIKDSAAAMVNKNKEGKSALGAEMNWKPSNVKIDLPLDLLSSKIGKPTSGDIKANMDKIKGTLENFGIPVEMGEISVGPTVTQYTFKPAEGVKLSRITGLNNDLALSLAAHPIRIEAPIPGKSLVGIEVPNQTKAIVGLREILESKSFKERKNNLMIALGKDVAGAAWLDDLTKMPHLLVAGATNSGKSVCLNTIIISLLYQNNPDELKFIMVDPKKVELPMYNGIPHLLTPVITEVSKTINALKWCLNEMDRRFEILAKHGKKNIQTYNESNKNGEKMPYIVFIIDELADLMVVAARDVEPNIIRLAQMARAVGIHLILATQRPSVNVITGVIKANMPARIAFSVASGIDSRTILDSLGAEKLIGRGDMLFSTAETQKPKRIQGAFVSENEIKRIANYIKEKSGEPAYIEGVTERQKVAGMAGVGLEGSSGDDDELLQEAKEIIINSGKASASYLQRRLSVGYARAARLLDLLEEIGVIGAANGSKPREILISKEQYDNMINQGVSGVSLHKMDEVEAPDSYLDSEDEEETPEEAFEEEVDTAEIKADIADDGELPVHAELKVDDKKMPEPDDLDDGKFFSR